MSKGKQIQSISVHILKTLGVTEFTQEQDIVDIIAGIIAQDAPSYIEKRVQKAVIAVLMGILKMRRYGRQPTENFRGLLFVIGYFTSNK